MSENIKKYPRTFHLIFSMGCSNDDKMLENNDAFINTDIVITSKLDGSNFCMTCNECFARSHSGPPTHKSFDYAKAFHSGIKDLIPVDMAVYAEYLFAKHSIFYDNLPHYMCIFNVLDTQNKIWLSWDNVQSIATKLSIPTVPVLFEGKFSSNKELQELCLSLMKEKEFDSSEREGLVIRLASSFAEQDFNMSTGKIVRANHVQTSDHWRDQEIIKNKLSS